MSSNNNQSSPCNIVAVKRMVTAYYTIFVNSVEYDVSCITDATPGSLINIDPTILLPVQRRPFSAMLDDTEPPEAAHKNNASRPATDAQSQNQANAVVEALVQKKRGLMVRLFRRLQLSVKAPVQSHSTAPANNQPVSLNQRVS